MVTPPAPMPTLEQVIKKCLKTKRFRTVLDTFFENIYDAAILGNQSWDRQRSYVGLQRDLPTLEREFIEVFNELTYGKRRTRYTTAKDISTVRELSEP